MATADSLPSDNIDRMTVVEVVENKSEAITRYRDAADSTTHEALLLLPSSKAALREYDLGILQSLVTAANKRAAEVRIICPIDKGNEHIIKWIKDNAPSIKILNGSPSSSTVLVVDGRKHFRAELKRADAEKFPDAIGNCIYSNSLPTVQTFKSCFELLWNSCTLNQELKRQEQARRDFVNIASHEIRTPIIPILANVELLKAIYDNRKDYEGKEEIEVIMRNALRLQRLTEDLLDVARIEGNTLQLYRENVNFHNLVSNIVEDYSKVLENLADSSQQKVQLQYRPDKTITDNLQLYIDRFRISQVLSNLLSNAIKHTTKEKEGTITVMASVQNEETTNSKAAVIVNVIDNGQGIDKVLLPKLFDKFASLSTTAHKGTGLGLFISKGIVEAHGGKICGKNNKDGRGATFTFTLPVDRQ